MNRDLSLIFAIAANGVIGRGGKLPWSEPDDRARYEKITAGHAVIMGRRTWEEMGVPLSGRHNVVVSTKLVAPKTVEVATTLEDALELAYAHDPSPFVIGGAALFAAALPLARRIYLTEIPGSPSGDAVFYFDRAAFHETSRKTTPSGLVFLVLER